MPLIHREDIRPGAFYGIWEVTETEAELETIYAVTSSERALIDSFTHEYRKKQFVATRALLGTLAPGERLRYDGNGKPWTESGSVFISLTHSGSYIAMMVDDADCGIDMETIRPKIERIAPKFLSEQELAEAGTDLERLHVYWCVKEALYKVYGQKNVSLRRDIFVQKPEHPAPGVATATLRHASTLLTRAVRYEKFRECMLAWTEQPR